jgi:CRISPR-associated protein Cas2
MGTVAVMAKRDLYLAAYDVSDPGRLREALKVLKNYACGGQKSVFECFLTNAEQRTLVSEVREVLDLEEDRFMLLQLGRGARVRALGVAVAPDDPDFFYVS